MLPSGSVCSVIYLKYEPSLLFHLPHMPSLSMVNTFIWHLCMPFLSDSLPWLIFILLSICSSPLFYSFILVLILCINPWLCPPLPRFTSLCIPNPQNLNSVTADVLLVCVCVYVCLQVCGTALCVWTIAPLCLFLLGSHWSPDKASLICTWHTEYTCANMGRHPLRRAQGCQVRQWGGGWWAWTSSLPSTPTLHFLEDRERSAWCRYICVTMMVFSPPRALSYLRRG